jgi:hypothetical protein
MNRVLDNDSQPTPLLSGRPMLFVVSLHVSDHLDHADYAWFWPLSGKGTVT